MASPRAFRCLSVQGPSIGIPPFRLKGNYLISRLIKRCVTRVYNLKCLKSGRRVHAALKDVVGCGCIGSFDHRFGGVHSCIVKSRSNLLVTS